MKQWIAALALAGLMMCAHAQEAEAPKPAPTAEEQAAIDLAEQRGAEIFRHDHAAAVATDAALEVRAFKRDKRMRGWITAPEGAGILVTFIDETPAALYRVHVDAEGKVAGEVEVLAEPAPLSAFETGAAKARLAARATKINACTERYNSVVLPADDAATRWHAWMIPASTDWNVVPLGGAYRFEVVDGKVVEQRAFTNTCISFNNRNTPSGGELAGLAVTHLLDPWPTEIHVFWQRWSRQPMFVAAGNSAWQIEGGQIELVDRFKTPDAQ
jgi:hypothetical protein